MMRSRGSVPMADNMSANFVTCSVLFFVWVLIIFRYLQKYGALSTRNKFLFPASPPGRSSSGDFLGGFPRLPALLTVGPTVPRSPAVLFFLNQFTLNTAAEASHVQILISFTRRCFSPASARSRG